MLTHLRRDLGVKPRQRLLHQHGARGPCRRWFARRLQGLVGVQRREHNALDNGLVVHQDMLPHVGPDEPPDVPCRIHERLGEVGHLVERE